MNGNRLSWKMTLGLPLSMMVVGGALAAIVALWLNFVHHLILWPVGFMAYDQPVLGWTMVGAGLYLVGGLILVTIIHLTPKMSWLRRRAAP